MKKVICFIAIAGALGIFCGVAYGKSDAKETTLSNSNTKKVQIRCSTCDGTGFTSNTKGEKGKGKFTCTRCKGTGKI